MSKPFKDVINLDVRDSGVTGARALVGATIDRAICDVRRAVPRAGNGSARHDETRLALA